jgi:uncharacterized protein
MTMMISKYRRNRICRCRAGSGPATPALAQRDPAYAAARAAGKVGEQADGYLGIVGAA